KEAIRKMSKKGTQNSGITRNENSVSNESSETIATSTSPNQDVQDLYGGIDNQTRAYVDTVIQSTAAALMQNMQQLMDQQI
ncbi:542_t:CDS:1, partial [Dentiscutata erythropus]